MADLITLEGVFTLEGFFTLLMLILLQAVLGFDNLLYISIESRRVHPPEKQAFVRRWGIGIAIGLRLVLLFVVMLLLKAMQNPFFSIHLGDVFHGEFTFHALITLFGGAFIMYTAMKEIFHLLSVDHLDHEDSAPKRTAAKALFWIITMNLIFSFDSILSALALTEVFLIMATAIVITGIMMIWLSDHISRFLEKNRAYEVLGLFILFIVGILLISDGGHLAHIEMFGYKVEAMSKATFYFVLVVMVAVSVVQSKYRNKLLAQRDHAIETGIPTTEPDIVHLGQEIAEKATPSSTS